MKAERADELRKAETFMIIGEGNATCSSCRYNYEMSKGDPDFPVPKNTRFQVWVKNPLKNAHLLLGHAGGLSMSVVRRAKGKVPIHGKDGSWFCCESRLWIWYKHMDRWTETTLDLRYVVVVLCTFHCWIFFELIVLHILTHAPADW